jgi:steroid delta-isomerase-like uncharacterized protein
MASRETNIALVRRYFYEVFNQADLRALEEICTPDFIFTLPTHSEPFRGVQGYRDLVNMLVGSFPDIHFAIEDMSTEGDRVLTRWSARGTHTGSPFPTVIGDIPAIGNSFSINGMTWHRIDGDRIAEVIANEDSLGLAQQMGRIILPEQAALTAPEARRSTPSPEDNARAVSRYFDEVMNQGKLETIDEIMSPNFAFFIPTLPDAVRGPDGMKRFVSGLHASFPDINFRVEYQVADGNRIATRYSMTGTHRAEFLGIPASNNAATDVGTTLFHFLDGRILRIWVAEDSLGLVRQLNGIT